MEHININGTCMSNICILNTLSENEKSDFSHSVQ